MLVIAHPEQAERYAPLLLRGARVLGRIPVKYQLGDSIRVNMQVMMPVTWATGRTNTAIVQVDIGAAIIMPYLVEAYICYAVLLGYASQQHEFLLV